MNELLQTYINEKLYRVIMSGANAEGGPSKIKIRPVLLQGKIKFQCTETHGPKELHKNYDTAEMIRYIQDAMETNFRQLQFEAEKASGSVLVSKKGKMTIKIKKNTTVAGPKPVLEHNRKKNYILDTSKPIPFLIDLGVMSREGKIINSKYDKFKQMNRFLEFVEDILPQLAKDREVTILDFGCGKSYLTFALYHYLHEEKGYDVNIIGLDLKEDVIDHCEGLARKYHYEKLHFFVGDIASYEGVSAVDMVVTLHACDTATDFALAKAVEWGAQVILSVPCCQHELNKQIENDMLAPIMSYGILKERMAALLTDGLRADMLSDQGYEVQILEFIDMEHTPKNLLIRAVKGSGKKKAGDDFRACMDFFHAKPTLEKLLYNRETKDT
ncbi:MAG: SAM-dependent methyltransferase [Lachnospiraceae bacterium]|nr:SAM-dependent methyltransferase [Lachnospiraceae bacterium]